MGKIKLNKDFFIGNDVVLIARELLGKVLCTQINRTYTSGIITETEAYAGITDKASHAYNGRRTQRTEVMYAEGGMAYVYLCYGIHHLFNVVTNKRDIPDAVLIRSIIPEDGKETIARRRKIRNGSPLACSGPGTVSQALGIKTIHSGTDLTKERIWIEDRGIPVSKNHIKKNPRIGVDYAGADALRLYRFTVSSESGLVASAMLNK